MYVTTLVPDPELPTVSATVAASMVIMTVSPDAHAAPESVSVTSAFETPETMSD